MLYHRVAFIHFLGCRADRRRGGAQLGAINDRLCLVSSRALPAGAAGHISRHIAHGGALNRLVCGRGDSIHGDAVIYDGVIIVAVIVNDRGLVKYISDFGRSQAPMAQIVISDRIHPNKSKVIGMQPKVYVHAHVNPVMIPTTVAVPIGAGR
jgi:hypothetical protein